jgi:gamma-glutamyltranspeptidase
VRSSPERRREERADPVRRGGLNAVARTLRVPQPFVAPLVGAVANADDRMVEDGSIAGSGKDIRSSDFKEPSRRHEHDDRRMSFGTAFAVTTRPTVMGRNAAVVAGHQLAAQAGLRMLHAGGNAVDAAIAMAASLAVLKPDACGVGSDLFLLYADAGGSVFALNASGPSPRLATRDEFPVSIAPWGLRASSVPGAVDGWYRAVTRFGRLAFRDVLDPAISFARDGSPVSALFASTLEKNEESLRRFPATRAQYYPGGRAPRAGEVLVQTDLARTLESIAQDGPDAFYRGAFASSLDRYSRESGALLRAGDLASYRSEWREPLRRPYRDYEIIGQPPPSVGLAVLEAMSILENFPIARLADASADLIHLQVEAFKIAMADVRGHLGDPAFVSQRAVPELLHPAHAAARAREIDPLRSGNFRAAELFAQAGTDTSYAAAIDAEGNAVSLLQSVFHIFGCGEVIPGTGVLMNNRMTAFSLDPASPNALEPGKRTLHTLNPLLVRDPAGAIMCLGTPGGPAQVSTNISLLTRAIDHALEPQVAIDRPRWSLASGDELQIEADVAPEVRAALGARGHRVVEVPAHSRSMGGAGIVRINGHGVREAGADPRRETYALAY